MGDIVVPCSSDCHFETDRGRSVLEYLFWEARIFNEGWLRILCRYLQKGELIVPLFQIFSLLLGDEGKAVA